MLCSSCGKRFDNPRTGRVEKDQYVMKDRDILLARCYSCGRTQVLSRGDFTKFMRDWLQEEAQIEMEEDPT